MELWGRVNSSLDVVVSDVSAQRCSAPLYLMTTLGESKTTQEDMRGDGMPLGIHFGELWLNRTNI